MKNENSGKNGANSLINNLKNINNFTIGGILHYIKDYLI